MANVVIDNTNLTNIATAIREKNGTQNTYKPSEMAAAIQAISAGGSFNGYDSTNYDITLLSAMPRDTSDSSQYKMWLEWSDYITDFDDVEILIYFGNRTTYFYIKGLCSQENGVFQTYYNLWSSSNQKNTLSPIGVNTISFDADGLHTLYNGSELTAAPYGAVYLVQKKKEVA